MSVICRDLLPLKYFERIKLVAGQNGLDRTVTWPYVGQTSTVSQWVHGGELLFITGIAQSADKLADLICSQEIGRSRQTGQLYRAQCQRRI